MGSPHQARLTRTAGRALARLHVRRAAWREAERDPAAFREIMQEHLDGWNAYSGGRLVATASIPEAALVKAMDAGYNSVLLRQAPQACRHSP